MDRFQAFCRATASAIADCQSGSSGGSSVHDDRAPAPLGRAVQLCIGIRPGLSSLRPVYCALPLPARPAAAPARRLAVDGERRWADETYGFADSLFDEGDVDAHSPERCGLLVQHDIRTRPTCSSTSRAHSSCSAQAISYSVCSAGSLDGRRGMSGRKATMSQRGTSTKMSHLRKSFTTAVPLQPSPAAPGYRLGDRNDGCA